MLDGVETTRRSLPLAARISDEQLEEICARYKAGETPGQLAPEFGVHKNSIKNLLKQNGTRLRKPGGRKPDPKPTRRRCGRCKKLLPFEKFIRDKHKTHGRSWTCYQCQREYVKERQIIHKYGMTLAEFSEMVERQGGGCAICGKEIYLTSTGRIFRLCIDHCHDTGEIRGVLCTRCNTGIGMFRDDPELLGLAIQYLNGD